MGLNAADGVNIHAEEESRLLDEFVIELSRMRQRRPR